MNLFCLVGQVHELPVLKEVGSGLKQACLVLKVIRPFRDMDGSYKFDYIPIEVWRGLAETLCASASLDTWISVKGRIRTSTNLHNGKTYTNYAFVAENISFIH